MSNDILDCHCNRCESFREVSAELAVSKNYCPCASCVARKLSGIYYIENSLHFLVFVILVTSQCQYWDSNLGFTHTWQRAAFFLFSFQMTAVIMYINSHSLILLRLLLVETEHHVFELAHALFPLDDYRHDINIWNRLFRELLSRNGNLVFSYQFLNLLLFAFFFISILTASIDYYKYDGIVLPFWLLSSAFVLLLLFCLSLWYVRRLNYAYQTLNRKVEATLNESNQHLSHQLAAGGNDRLELIIEKAVEKLKKTQMAPTKRKTKQPDDVEEQVEPRTIKSVLSFESQNQIQRKDHVVSPWDLQIDLDKSREISDTKFFHPMKKENTPEPNIFNPDPNIFSTLNTNLTSVLPRTPRGSRSYIEGVNQDISLRYERLGKQMEFLRNQEKQLLYLLSFRITNTFIDGVLFKILIFAVVSFCVEMLLGVKIEFVFLPVRT